jgi:hypothetical protein
LELLTIFYAMLAALTGLVGGDRVALADRAAVVASANPCADLAVIRQSPAPATTSRPYVEVARRWLGDTVALPQMTAPHLSFNIAGFANRRE